MRKSVACAGTVGRSVEGLFAETGHGGLRGSRLGHPLQGFKEGARCAF